MSKAGLTPAELARRTGIGDNVISRWRKGTQQPTTNMLKKLNEMMGWPMGPMLVASGHIREEDLRVNRRAREAQAEPEVMYVDELEAEILASTRPGKVRDRLLAMREAQRDEIRNWLEIARDQQASGHTADTASDSA